MFFIIFVTFLYLCTGSLIILPPSSVTFIKPLIAIIKYRFLQQVFFTYQCRVIQVVHWNFWSTEGTTFTLICYPLYTKEAEYVGARKLHRMNAWLQADWTFSRLLTGFWKQKEYTIYMCMNYPYAGDVKLVSSARSVENSYIHVLHWITHNCVGWYPSSLPEAYRCNEKFMFHRIQMILFLSVSRLSIYEFAEYLT